MSLATCMPMYLLTIYLGLGFLIIRYTYFQLAENAKLFSKVDNNLHLQLYCLKGPVAPHLYQPF